jgi:hypothetical protein
LNLDNKINFLSINNSKKMNYKNYFILEPGQARCRQESCPRQIVQRKQGNTSGMRFHLKKYHPQLFEEFQPSPGTKVEIPLVRNSNNLISNFGQNNNYKAELSSSDFLRYTNEMDNSTVNDQEEEISTSYDGKAGLMDMLFNESNDPKLFNITQNHFEEPNDESAIPSKRARQEMPVSQQNPIVFELADPREIPYYGFPLSDDSPPSPSTTPQLTALQNSTRRTRYQFSEIDKSEIKKRIKKKELSLVAVAAGTNDIMSYVIDGYDKIAVFCSICGAILSAKGGGSITYHRNMCLRLADMSRQQSHPLPIEVKKKIHQKCLNMVTKNFLPASLFKDDGLLDLLQFVHNLGYSYGIESARSAKEDISYGPATIGEAMPISMDLQRIIDQTILNYYPQFIAFINENITDGGGALTVTKLKRCYHYLGFTFHFITKDWKLVSVPIVLEEYPQQPTTLNIEEASMNLLRKYNILESNVTFVTTEEKEFNDQKNLTEDSMNYINLIQSASNLLKTVVKWVFKPLNEKTEFPTGLKENFFAISSRLGKFIEIIQNVFEYAKSKPMFYQKLELSSVTEDSFGMNEILTASSMLF